jgi:hypothetical protein
MANVKSNPKPKFQKSFRFWTRHLTFACLPCLPQAGAGRDFELWIYKT